MATPQATGETPRSLFSRFATKTRQMAEAHPKVAIALGASLAVAAALTPSPVQPAVVSLLVVKAATAVLPARFRREGESATPETASILGKFVQKTKEIGQKHPLVTGALLTSAVVGSLLIPVPTPIHAAVAGLVVRGTIMGLSSKKEPAPEKESRPSLFGRFIGAVKSLAEAHPKIAGVTIAAAVVATTLAGTHALGIDSIGHASTLASQTPAAVHSVVPHAMDSAAKAIEAGTSPHEALSSMHHTIASGVAKHLHHAKTVSHAVAGHLKNLHHAVAAHHVAPHHAPAVHHAPPVVAHESVAPHAPVAHAAPPVAAPEPAVADNTPHVYIDTDYIEGKEVVLHTTAHSAEILKNVDVWGLRELTGHFGSDVSAVADPHHAGHFLVDFHAGDKVLTIPVDESGHVVGTVVNHAMGADGTLHEIPVPDEVNTALRMISEDMDYEIASGPGM